MNFVKPRSQPSIKLDLCFPDGALDRKRYDALLTRARDGVARLKRQYDDNSLPLLRLPERRDDLDEMSRLCAKLMSDTSDVVVLGIGGSALGAQNVASLAGVGLPSFGPGGFPSRQGGVTRLHILDNPDPESVLQALLNLPLRSTRFLVVSKSGGTAEPLVLAMAAISAVERALGPEGVASRFAAIVEPGDNPLRRLIDKFGWDSLNHPPAIGGRYSVLSVVGMLPAALAGLDPVEFRLGAAAALAPSLADASPEDIPSACGAAWAVAGSESGKNVTVLMPYAERLDRLAAWYGQLWAESLGKDGKGSTPVGAVGPVDQHSQLQLYLDGPADKLFTLVLPMQKGLGPRLKAPIDDPAFTLFEGHRIGDLIQAQGRATAETLYRRKRPVRVIEIATIDPYQLGYLMMHFMLETIIAADLLGIDAFNQPAVEEGKVLARDYLRDS